ncbi:Gfo/Idh/MocA family protein [Sphingobacterium sp. WOUb80]|uniref:Gfo/Idh/MocA family protein n=1 Tax=Sphingobacterium sp. WOUb80 TaxID=3234028 RepID=UPI003CF052D0
MIVSTYNFKMTEMNSKRRNFLKLAGLSSLSVLSGKIFAESQALLDKEALAAVSAPKQKFNMCGYAAPKMDKVRIGFIGVGNRGASAVYRIAHIDGVEVKAIADIRRTVAERAAKHIKGETPTIYADKEDEWKKLCDRSDIDLVYICTPWHLHTPMAVYAMKAGKHVAVEVPIATTVEECWQLVETSEATKKHCMMLENCCYDFFELMTLNMARQGLFGEILHGEGAYLHNLLQENFAKDSYYEMWRLKENFRNGNLYPTHGLGPICQLMDINRGDKMTYLTSMSSNDFSMHAKAVELAAKDTFYNPYAGRSFRGNMNTTTIRTQRGRTIMLQHDVSSPRPYSRIHLVSGTKGMAQKWPEPERIAFGHDWISGEEMKNLEQQYTPEIVLKVCEMAKKVGGHGGMDFMMDWRLIDCLRNGLPLDQDVYDAALWSVIAPLSERSVKNRSNSVDIPDFTRGAWATNAKIELSLKGGGNTGMK